MGAFLSKSKPSSSSKVVPEPALAGRVVSSAPAQLEHLEGTSPSKTSPSPSFRARAITPPETSTEPALERNSAPQSLPARALSKSQSVQRPPALQTVVELPSPSGSQATTPVADAAGPATPSVATASATTPPGPTGKRGPKKIDVIGDQSDGQKLAAAMPAAIAIPDEAQAWSKVYGESVVRNFHSADWKDREQSLSAIQRSLGNVKFLAGKEPGAVYAATAEMLTKTLKDKVAPIFHASLELVSTLLASFSTLLPKHVLHASFDPLMPIIVHRCGNLNTRIHESSLQTLLAVANFPSFGCSYVGPFALAEPPKRNRDASQAAQMYGRLDLVCCLLAAFKTTQGLAVVDVMRFCKTGLDMPDEKVRQAATKAIIELYKLQKTTGQELVLEKHLGAIKPALMQVLQKRCEEADAELAGAPASSGNTSSEAPAASNGIKVYGKSLPPLKQTATMQLVAQGMALKPATPDTPGSAGPSPLGPGLRAKQPLSGPGAKRERARMASASPSSPRTPPNAGKARVPLSSLPELEVPKYTQMISGSTPGSRGGVSSRGSTRPAPGTPSTPGALDDAEENLIQYILGDDKIMEH